RLAHGHSALRAVQPARRLELLRGRLEALAPRAQAAMARQLQRDALHLRGIARSLEAVSPLATVARGYAILTRADDGALVRSTAQVRPGDALQARVGDGVVDVRVAGTETAPQEQP
uniref:exodeoxyribonuclease VII large subunit n=1 Tax=Stenotrophomonas sp. PS02297 TaxID=2991423 RepID=UPI00249CC510